MTTVPLPPVHDQPIRVQRPKAPARWRMVHWYVLVAVLAAAARGAWALLVPIKPLSDSFAYDIFARNLAAGRCFGWDADSPSAFWPVGTSFMYSLVYRVFDPDAWGYGPVSVLNLVLGVAMVVLGMAVAHRWFGKLVGISAGVMLAFWPTHVQFTTVIGSETIFTVLCLASILAWPEPGERRTLARVAVAGVLLALATYVRPTALLLPVVLAGSAWLRGLSFPRAAGQVALAAVVMAVIIAPWSVRNTRLFGQFVLVSTNGGSNLWMGNNPQTTGFYQDRPPQPSTMNEAQFDKELGRQAKAWIVKHPGAFIARTAVKAVRLHERETIGIAWNQDALSARLSARSMTLMKVSGQAYWLVALAASLCGVMILTLRYRFRALVHPAIAIWGYFTAVHAVIVIQDRYHLPATPMIASLAALAFVAAWTWKRKPGAVEAEATAPARTEPVRASA